VALLLAAALALLAGLAGAALAWHAAHELESPIVALIKGAERIGQGDYTRPVEVLRQDVLGELQQALERMRGRLRQSTINKNYLHSVLNSMTDAVFVTSPDGVIKVANSAACKLLAFGEEEISAAALSPCSMSASARASTCCRPRRKPARRSSGRATARRSRYRSRDRASKAPTAVPGQHLRRAHITDRKRAERRIRIWPGTTR